MTSTFTFRIHRPRLASAIQGLGMAVALAVTSACATSTAPAQPPQEQPPQEQPPQEQPPQEQPPQEQPSVKPADELRALIGDASCSDHAQCRTIAWGSKACGGPQSYVAYSTLRTDASRLEALAKRHAEAQARDNEASGRISNCMLVTDPGAQCVANRCVLNKVPAAR